MAKEKGKENSEQQNTQLQVVSERFVTEVQRQFVAEMGNVLAFTEYERTLAQHLFLKADAALKDFEAKRLTKNNANQITPYVWENINMRKLSLDAVHRVNLGLDAAIPNHIHPVPYFNGKEKKYDLDLRIGYIGKDYYRRDAAVEKPVNVIYELVYSNDKFRPIKKSFNNEIESYEFEVTNPFDRGNIVGGFGYIMYEDPRKNLLVILTEADFQKSEAAAPGETFWKKHPTEMRYKTLVHRTTEKLRLDPRKVNSKSYAYVENQEKEEQAQREIDENANTTTIDVKPESVTIVEPEAEPEPQQSPPELEEQQTTAGPGF